MLYDPIPDPIAAGWTKEGNEPYLPTGTTLRITDTTKRGHRRFLRGGSHHDSRVARAIR